VFFFLGGGERERERERERRKGWVQCSKQEKYI